MFESHERLAADIRRLLEALRELGEGRYACIVEPGRVLFESPHPPGPESAGLRRLLSARRPALFALPDHMEAEGPGEDVFAGEPGEFLVAVLNGRVALVVACADAHALERDAERALHALADRLIRYDQGYALDRHGRGLFFGSPRLDVVVVGGAA